MAEVCSRGLTKATQTLAVVMLMKYSGSMTTTTAVQTFQVRYIKGLSVWLVEDEGGNRALNAGGLAARYKTEAAAQRRADKVNSGIDSRTGDAPAGRAKRGVPVGGRG